MYAPSGKIIAPQDHFWMGVDRFQRHLLLVAAGQCQKHAALCQSLEGALKIAVRLANMVMPTQAQAAPADLADNAAPQRFVQIEHHQFFAAAV